MTPSSQTTGSPGYPGRFTSDFYEKQERLFLAEEELERVNVFDWDKAFPSIVAQGGFDAVVGNPPYGIPFGLDERSYLGDRHSSLDKFLDSYALFIVAGVELLCNGGYMSLIVPNTFCDLESGEAFRAWLLQTVRLDRIWQSGWAFKDAIVDTLVFRITNASPNTGASVDVTVGDSSHARSLESFASNGLKKIDYRNSHVDRDLVAAVLGSSRPLGEVCVVKAGVKLYEKGKGVPAQTAETLKIRPYTRSDGEADPGWRPLYRGKDVAPFMLKDTQERVHYGPWLAAPREPQLFEPPKLLMRRTDWHLLAALDTSAAICVNSCHVIKLKDEAGPVTYALLTSLLNSRLMQRVFEIQNPQMVGKVFAEIKVVYVERLPVPLLAEGDSDKVANLLVLQERYLTLRASLDDVAQQEREARRRVLAAAERAHENAVRGLYGLPPLV